MVDNAFSLLPSRGSGWEGTHSQSAPGTWVKGTGECGMLGVELPSDVSQFHSDFIDKLRVMGGQDHTKPGA